MLLLKDIVQGSFITVAKLFLYLLRLKVDLDSVLYAKRKLTFKSSLDPYASHIDAAWVYGNEGEVGEAIEASINKGTVKREDLFIATKLWNTFHKPQDVVKGCDMSLANLRVKQIGKFSSPNYLDRHLSFCHENKV